MQTSPKELLIKIGTTYRVWQLLRLTCKNIYVVLGDYSVHTGIEYKYTQYNEQTESYNRADFINTLINILGESHIMYPKKGLRELSAWMHGTIYINCTISTDLYPRDHARLILYNNGARICHLVRSPDRGNIIIRGILYIVFLADHLTEHSGPFISYIFEHLPELFMQVCI